MYEELIAALRFCDGGECDGCCRYKKEHGAECYTLLREAADAIEERDKYALTIQHEMMAEAESHVALVERLNKQIEELELHYCPHAIRNVHDRGDDSICEKYKCEVTALPRWIPVSEKKPPLPEDEDVCFADVIAAIRGRKESAQVKYCRAYRYRDGKRECIERFIDDWEVVYVTHWMPLPEPPKEEA